jgi:hypothetical protein
MFSLLFITFATKPHRFSSKTHEAFTLSFCPSRMARALLVRRPEVVRPNLTSSDDSKSSDEYTRPAILPFFKTPAFSTFDKAGVLRRYKTEGTTILYKTK